MISELRIDGLICYNCKVIGQYPKTDKEAVSPEVVIQHLSFLPSSMVYYDPIHHSVYFLNSKEGFPNFFHSQGKGLEVSHKGHDPVLLLSLTFPKPP